MKTILSFVLSAALLLCTLPVQIVKAADSDIILVSTKEEFNAIRNDLAGKYRLANDIEFAPEDFQEGGEFYNDDIGWMPIGSSNEPFTGVLDGNDFKVSGIDTTWTDEDYEALGTNYVGLFGVSEGEIKNLSLDNHFIALSEYYGGDYFSRLTNEVYLGNLVGYNRGIVSNCRNFSAESVTSMTRGGLVGINSGSGSIYRCSNNNYYQGSRHMTGGIAIRNYGSISQCVNTASINTVGRFLMSSGNDGWGYAGGIAAYNCGTISDCFNAGAVLTMRSLTQLQPPAAGIAVNERSASNTPYGTVSRCYSIGYSSNSDYYRLISNQGMENCYAWNIRGNAKGNEARTAEQMQDQSTYEGFDFDNVWEMSTDERYVFPVLKNVSLDINYRLVTGGYLSKAPDRTTFDVGEKIDLSGTEFTISYSDGTIVTYDNHDPLLNSYDIDFTFSGLSSFPSEGTYEVVIFSVPFADCTTTPITLKCEKKQLMPGDVDRSGTVTVADVLIIKRAIAGLLELTPEQRAAADVNGDGRVNAGDILLIKRHIAGLITLPV